MPASTVRRLIQSLGDYFRTFDAGGVDAPKSQGVTLCDTDGEALSSLSVTSTNGLTNTQLRASPLAVTLSGTVPTSGPLTDTQLRASAVPVSDGGSSLTVDGPVTDAQLRATAVPVSGPLTDAQLRATDVPVSGPLTDTELRDSPVAVEADLLSIGGEDVPTNGSGTPTRGVTAFGVELGSGTSRALITDTIGSLFTQSVDVATAGATAKTTGPQIQVVDQAGNAIQPMADTAGRLLVTSGLSFEQAIAAGTITGHNVVDVRGLNSDVDTTTDPEDVWDGGGLYTGQPVHSASAETLNLVSSDANDTSAGTGARTVEITGLNASWAVQTETVTMNGTTPVTTVNQWRRVFSLRVATAGSGGKNAGQITAQHTTTSANVFQVMVAGTNRSYACAYTIPASQVGFLTGFYAGLVLASAAAASATVSVRIREEGGLYRAEYRFVVSTTSPLSLPMKVPVILPAKTDILLRVDAVDTDNTQVNGMMNLVIVS